MPDNQRTEKLMLIRFFNICLFFVVESLIVLSRRFTPPPLLPFKPILIMKWRAVSVRPEPHFQPPDGRKSLDSTWILSRKARAAVAHVDGGCAQVAQARPNLCASLKEREHGAAHVSLPLLLQVESVVTPLI